MIRLTVLHPKVEGNTFNLAYYLEKHIPLARAKFGAALKGVTVDAGVGGMPPGSPAPFVVIAQLLFESVDTMKAAFAAAGTALRDDQPNFTGVSPTMQVSEVKL
jgi:uncharacterized protein (TIGR02118 family)